VGQAGNINGGQHGIGIVRHFNYERGGDNVEAIAPEVPLRSSLTTQGDRDRVLSSLSLSVSVVRVTIKLFAAYQDAYGVPELTWEFPDGMPVRAILDRCCSDYPQLEQWREVTRFGINLEFATPDTLLQEGDEVVLIPPVSGGMG